MVNEHQNEFFGEFEKKKGGIEMMRDKITEKRKKLYLNMPLENAVFGAIVIIMCVVTAFALGVERGKRLDISSAPAKAAVEKDQLDEGLVQLGPIEVAKSPEKVLEPPVKAEEKKPALKTMRYTVQLISYKKEKRAQKEIKKLGSQNVRAFITTSGDWYQVCAGSYNDIKEAKKALGNYKVKYKGCFVKNI